MKKSKIILTSFLTMLAIIFLVACSNDSGGNTPKSYSITASEGSNYKLENLPEEALAGESVSFSVESTSVFYEVASVNANDETLSPNGRLYTFMMPEEDVAITVTMSEVSEYDNPDDKLSWARNISKVISAASAEDKTVSWDVSQNLNFNFGISSSNYVTSINATIESSNEDVIPNDAITFVKRTASSSNVITGGYLKIDLKKVNPGETLLYVNLKPNNSSLGTLITKFKVVEYGTIELETMPVTLEIDNNSDYDLTDLFLNIRDENYVYGSQGKQTQTIYLKDIVDNKISFDYIVGHSYFLSCGINDGTGNSLNINDWVGSGSSSSGYNQIKNNILTLLTSGVTAEITITD